MVDVATIPVPENQIAGLSLAHRHASAFRVLCLRPVGQVDPLRTVRHGDQTRAVIAGAFARPHVSCAELALRPSDGTCSGIRITAATAAPRRSVIIVVIAGCGGRSWRVRVLLFTCATCGFGSCLLARSLCCSSLACSFSGCRLTLRLELGLALINQLNGRVLLTRKLSNQSITASSSHGLRITCVVCSALSCGRTSFNLCGCFRLLGLCLDRSVIHDVCDLLKRGNLLHFDVCRGREGVERGLLGFDRAQSVGGKVGGDGVKG